MLLWALSVLVKDREEAEQKATLIPPRKTTGDREVKEISKVTQRNVKKSEKNSCLQYVMANANRYWEIAFNSLTNSEKCTRRIVLLIIRT